MVAIKKTSLKNRIPKLAQSHDGAHDGAHEGARDGAKVTTGVGARKATFANTDFDERTVYVRQLFPGDEIYQQVEPHISGKHTELFAVMTLEGEPVAFVNDRNIAFAGARRHDLRPVSAH